MVKVLSRKVRATSSSSLPPPDGPPSDIPALDLQKLRKAYGDVEAVRGLDLQVRNGEFLTVLGPSGSGKTTVLQLIAGFAEATSGRILLSGRDVSGMTPSERGIGMVFQNYALFPHMTAEDNIAYGLKMRGWARPARRERVREILELVGLRNMEHRLPRELSGGQQQRVALGRALAFDPPLLLMDEPLGALDRELRIRMTRELRRIQRELKATFVYVTHDREEALTLSDRIAIMHDGRLEALGGPKDLYDQPPSRFVASFFGGHNVIPAQVVTHDETSAVLEVLGGTIRVPTPQPLTTGPAALVVPTAAVTTAIAEHGFVFEAQIESLLYLGEVVQVTFTGPGQDATLFATVPADQAGLLEAGGRHRLALDSARLVAVA